MTFIDYPVAPENRFKETLESVHKTYLYLNKEYPNDTFILVGDSAGGGLALSLAQILSAKPEIIRPEKLVLFSPWLDISMENPEIDFYEKKRYDSI